MFQIKKLGIDEIVAGLNAANINVSANHIKVPKQEMVTKILKSYLLFLTGIGLPQLCLPDFQVCDESIVGELGNGFAFLNAFKHLNKISKATGITNFSLKDFYAPNKERLIYILSGLMNFAFYAQNKIITKSEKDMISHQIKEENQELQAIITQLEVKIKSKESELKEKTTRIEELNVKRNNLKDKISETEVSKNIYCDEIKKIIQKKDEKISNIEQLEERIVSMKEESEQLKMQLSYDPSKTEKLIKIATEKLDEVQAKATELENQQKNCIKRKKFIDESRSLLIDVLEQCHPISLDFKKAQDLKVEAASLENRKIELNELKDRIKNLRKQNDTFEQQKQKHVSSVSEMKAKLKALKREKAKLQTEKKNIGYKLEDTIGAMRIKYNEFFETLSRSMNDVEAIQI